MIDFLHTFEPASVLLHLGPITIYWYGLCIVFGVISAISVSTVLAKKNGLDQDKIIDLSLWLVLSGIIGARIYDVILELPYYLEHPQNILKIWQGGLAIHGGIIGGVIALWLFAKKEKIGFWLLSDLIVPGVALGQAIGRWGNYFNQELFGRPTGLPWGIPISMINRPTGFNAFGHFHPTFLYESVGSLLIFTILVGLHIFKAKKQNKAIKPGIIAIAYLISYSILRFSLEFIRIDKTPEILGLRWPQWASIIIIITSVALVLIKIKKDDTVQNSSHTLN